MRVLQQTYLNDVVRRNEEELHKPQLSHLKKPHLGASRQKLNEKIKVIRKSPATLQRASKVASENAKLAKASQKLGKGKKTAAGKERGKSQQKASGTGKSKKRPSA